MGAITSVITRIKDIICCTGADVNSKNSDGNTALHLAVLESKDVGHGTTLIDAGVDVNTRTSEGKTALHLAVLESIDVSHVKTLIDAGADVNTQASERETALHLAVLESKDVSHVKTLIDAGADVNTQTSERETALHLAVLESKDVSHVKTLIDAGADVNTRTSEGKTALHLAVLESNDVSHLKTLIDACADVNTQTSEGETALRLAVLESKDVSHVKTLIDAGADVNTQNSNRNTALHLAVLESIDVSHVETLIDAGADVNTQNSNRNTALHLAMLESIDLSHVKTLIDIGADVNTQNSNGNTALHLAVLESKDVSHVKTFIDAGADVNRQNFEGKTALHLAVLESKNLSHVKTLIDAGSDVNYQNSRRNTALHLCLLNIERFSLMTFDPLAFGTATETNVKPLQSHTITLNANLLEDYDIAETLINKGADLNIQNNDGNTPLHLALINSKPQKLVDKSNDKKDHLDTQCPEDVKVFKLASKESNMYKLVKKMIDKGVDVRKQNNKGNTALHLALSSELRLADKVYEMFERQVSNVHLITPYPKIVNDNFEKLLQILLGNSETIYTCNRLGMDPIQMIIHERHDIRLQKFSWMMTITPLLNLEYHEHFSYSDCHGNTLLHLLMESYQYMYLSPIILKSVLESVDPIYLKFNVQNKAGNTPLHSVPVEMITYILSNYDKVDLFARNKRKETFLHKIFKFQEYNYPYNDIKKILQGQCNYCSKEDVKKLLHCRDIAGNTPLHLFITNQHLRVRSFQLFYEAGADINACNIYKESILHCLVRTDDSEEKIKFAVEHGAELNVQNAFGESPIFLTMQMEVMKRLVESGADLNICNKTGQNPLLSLMHKDDLRLFDTESLIKKFNLKVKDIHGNNLLHYVAWHGMYRFRTDYCYVVNILLDAGAEIEPDALGQLPCHIAHQMGHAKLARRLCKCENTGHLDKFTFTNKNINLYQILKKLKNLSSWQNFQTKRKYFANYPITDIMEMPFIGSVNFEDESEAKEIRSCIVNIINDICKRLGQENDLLKNKVIQSGSVGENTKVGLPDEFDFLCVFNTVSKACYVETVSKVYPGYAVVKLKDEFRGHRCQSLFDFLSRFDEDCYFSSSTDFDYFMTALRDVVQCLDIYSHPYIIYKWIFHNDARPNVELYFVWTGHKYKGMEIKVDLVPAMQIKGWWPPGTRLYSLACDTKQKEQLRKDGAVLLFQGVPGNTHPLCQISVFAAEKNHLAGLPQKARNAYRIAKILCDKRICPGQMPYYRTNITSYMLKNCMFYVLENPIESVYDCVCKIYRYLIKCTKNKRLLPYVYPHRNIFAGKSSDSIIYMRICSQIILNMIGSPEEFLPSDLDEMIRIQNRLVIVFEAEDTEDEYTEYIQ